MLPETFILLHAERLHKRSARLNIQATILPHTKGSFAKKISTMSRLLMEAFDLRRTAEVLERWNGLSKTAQRQLLEENGRILVLSYKTILEEDLEGTQTDDRRAA